MFAQRVDIQQAIKSGPCNAYWNSPPEIDQLQAVSSSSPSIPTPVLVPAALAPVIPPVSDCPLVIHLPPLLHFSGDLRAHWGFINQYSINLC